MTNAFHQLYFYYEMDRVYSKLLHYISMNALKEIRIIKIIYYQKLVNVLFAQNE